MCEHSNVNLAANLREARRRKILQNSENRLKLIEGISSSLGKSSSSSSLSPSNEYLEPKPEPEVRKSVNSLEETSNSQLNSKFNDIIEANEELKEISDFLLRDNSKTSEEDKPEKEEEEDPEAEEIQEKKVWFQVFFHKKLHYMLLALIVNILLFFNAGFLFYENIFCPFYTVKIIELLLVAGGSKEDFQLIPSLFFGSVPKSVQKFSRVITGLVHLLSDLCVYLYTFVIATKFFNQN